MFYLFCSFGLIFGQSGSGKTTLLQVFCFILLVVYFFLLFILVICDFACFCWQILAGINKPTSGSICIQRYGDDGKPNQYEQLPPERVGIVFQFPERYPAMIGHLHLVFLNRVMLYLRKKSYKKCLHNDVASDNVLCCELGISWQTLFLMKLHLGGQGKRAVFN